jgi:hypothetical protein
MARLSEYNYDLCLEICEKVANGENIKKILISKQLYPNFTTWCKWRREHDELNNLYVRSVQDKAESVDDRIDEIMEKVESKEIDHMTGRLMIDTLKWKAAKYYPKMFGDKVQTDTNITGDVSITWNEQKTYETIDKTE